MRLFQKSRRSVDCVPVDVVTNMVSARLVYRQACRASLTHADIWLVGKNAAPVAVLDALDKVADEQDAAKRRVRLGTIFLGGVTVAAGFSGSMVVVHPPANTTLVPANLPAAAYIAPGFDKVCERRQYRPVFRSLPVDRFVRAAMPRGEFDVNAFDTIVMAFPDSDLAFMSTAAHLGAIGTVLVAVCPKDPHPLWKWAGVLTAGEVTELAARFSLSVLSSVTTKNKDFVEISLGMVPAEEPKEETK